jgi:hypothetical protein
VTEGQVISSNCDAGPMRGVSTANDTILLLTATGCSVNSQFGPGFAAFHTDIDSAFLDLLRTKFARVVPYDYLSN